MPKVASDFHLEAGKTDFHHVDRPGLGHKGRPEKGVFSRRTKLARPIRQNKGFPCGPGMIWTIEVYIPNLSSNGLETAEL